LIRPVPLDLALNGVIVINAAVTALILVYVLARKSRQLGRPMGMVLLVAYAGYVVWSLKS